MTVGLGNLSIVTFDFPFLDSSIFPFMGMFCSTRIVRTNPYKRPESFLLSVIFGNVLLLPNVVCYL